MNGAKLDVVDLVKQYPDNRALDTVSLNVEAGSYTVILGPSGSGKTTLLAILGGFAQPTSGRIEVDGEDVTHLSPAKRPTTTVFQDYALFPHLTVGQNVGFGLEMKRISTAERKRVVAQSLDMVGLSHTINRHIADLSGGQRQRIALARALIVEPRVLLLDEPLGALDLKLRRQMQDELTSIHRRVGTTFIHVTHDQEEAMSLADNIVILRDGRIEDMGSPDRLYLHPATAFSAKFMGDSNVIDGTVLSGSATGARVETPWGIVDTDAGFTEGEKVTLSIRPEHITEAQFGMDNLGVWTVTEAHFLGQRHRAMVERSGETLLVSLPQESTVRHGDDVTLGVQPGFAKVVKGENA